MMTTVLVAGMHTEHCKRAVFTALAAVPGITAADVQLGTVVIDHDGQATADALDAAIAVAGYIVTAVHDNRRTLTILPSSDSTSDSTLDSKGTP